MYSRGLIPRNWPRKFRLINAHAVVSSEARGLYFVEPSSEPSMLAEAISIKISCTDPYLLRMEIYFSCRNSILFVFRKSKAVVPRFI